MPRAARTPVRLVIRPIRPKDGTGPRLWNAKRRIKTTSGLGLPDLRALRSPTLQSLYDHALPRLSSESETQSEEWRRARDTGIAGKETLEWWRLGAENVEKLMDEHPVFSKVSSDVRTFIARGGHMFNQSTILRILKDPASYFAAPRNVPLKMRRQVSFPDPKDAVVLMRTPHLGPRYAAFDVPLHFNKLDLRAYLKDVYNVDVLHVRSVIIQAKADRKEPSGRYSQGQAFRAPSKKKMTCLLAQPFVYPDEVENLDPWDTDVYWMQNKAAVAKQREEDQWGQLNPNQKRRNAFALQAQQLLKGQNRWAPTWQNFPQDVRVMQPLASAAAPSQTEPHSSETRSP